MKLCRFDDHRLGVVEGEEVVDVTEVLAQLPAQRYPLPRHDLLIAHLPELRGAIAQAARQGARKPVSQVHWLPPVANPGKIIGAPINYAAHASESATDANIGHGRTITSIGDWGLFLKAGSSLIGVSDEVRLRFPQRRNDHEVELAVVIGKTCRQVKAADAMAHVAAYSLSLDMTLRGPEFQCFRKSIDTYAVLGPWLVTADEVPDPQALTMIARVNGQEWSRGTSADMQHSFAAIISHASDSETFYAGEVIGSGTVGGGCGNELGRFLKHGDVMELEVSGLGVLSNNIVAPHVLQVPTMPIHILD